MIFVKERRKIRARRIVNFYSNFINNGDNVLDIGCGDGVLATELRKQMKKDFDLVGVDVVKNNPLFKFFLQTEENLPFKDNEFDITILNDVLHHIPYKQQLGVLKEALRVAEKVLICEVPNTKFAKFADKINNFGKKMDIPFCMRSKKGWEYLFKNFKIKSFTVKAELLHPVRNHIFCLEIENGK